MALTDPAQETHAVVQTCNYYNQLVEDSRSIQQVVASFASSLATSLTMLPRGSGFETNSSSTKEMQTVREHLSVVLQQIRSRVERDVAELTEVNLSVAKMHA